MLSSPTKTVENIIVNMFGRDMVLEYQPFYDKFTCSGTFRTPCLLTHIQQTVCISLLNVKRDTGIRSALR